MPRLLSLLLATFGLYGQSVPPHPVFETDQVHMIRTFGGACGQGIDPGGNNAAPYKQMYELETNESADDWTDLIRLSLVLNSTPVYASSVGSERGMGGCSR